MGGVLTDYREACNLEISHDNLSKKAMKLIDYIPSGNFIDREDIKYISKKMQSSTHPDLIIEEIRRRKSIKGRNSLYFELGYYFSLCEIYALKLFEYSEEYSIAAKRNSGPSLCVMSPHKKWQLAACAQRVVKDHCLLGSSNVLRAIGKKRLSAKFNSIADDFNCATYAEVMTKHDGLKMVILDVISEID